VHTRGGPSAALFTPLSKQGICSGCDQGVGPTHPMQLRVRVPNWCVGPPLCCVQIRLQLRVRVPNWCVGPPLCCVQIRLQLRVRVPNWCVGPRLCCVQIRLQLRVRVPNWCAAPRLCCVQIRLQLGALASAHDARAAQQSASRLSHAITLAVLDACEC